MGYTTFQGKIIEEDKQGAVYENKGKQLKKNGKKMYLESYGCQMNFSDSEIVASIMIEEGYESTPQLEEADVVLVNTCAIRDNAEQRVRNRLARFQAAKKKKPAMVIGVLGCMAERLKKKLLEEEKAVDVVVGPDAYRDLPNLVDTALGGQKAVNVFLSRDETYADISPVRLDSNGVTAFISIMRGCDNMCSFCVVPFTRGRERSRDPETIVQEAQDLVDKGYKEVTLLGQNVDSYKFTSADGGITDFADLLEKVAQLSPQLRVRFSTSHPKDITEKVVQNMAAYPNICDYIHFPAQSGNSRILKKMNRTYDREWYLNRVAMIKKYIPDCGMSSDMIAGFCSETEDEHRDTLTLMEQVRYDMSYMFYYSERPGTLAAKKYEDDVPLEVKKRRLQEIIDLQRVISLENNQKDIGKTFEVLVEGDGKKEGQKRGRNSQNKMCVFHAPEIKAGTYVNVKIEDCSSGSLFGRLLSEHDVANS